MGIPAPAGVAASGVPAAGDMANAVVTGKFTAVGPSAPFALNGPFNLAVWASVNTTLTTTAGSLTATVASGSGLANGNAINSVNVPAGATIGNLSGTTVTLALAPVTFTGIAVSGLPIISGLASTAGLLGATVSGPGIPSGTTVVAIPTPAVAGNGAVPAVLGTVQLSANATASSPVAGSPFQFAVNGNAVLVTGADAAATFTGAAIDYSGSVQLERSFDGGSTWIVCGVGGQGAQAVFSAGTPISVVAGEPERGVLYRLNCTAYTSGTINYRMSATGAAAMSMSLAAAI